MNHWVALLRELQGYGLTQSEIAQRCGSFQTTIASLLHGRALQPKANLGKAIEALHRTETRKAARAAKAKLVAEAA